MSILILGHSFIRRFRDYLTSSPTLNLNLNISSVQQHAYLFEGGCKLTGRSFQCLMHNVHLHLATTNIHAIYISLGTNDLDSGMPPLEVARHIWALARRLCSLYRPRYVFIEEIIHRNPDKFPGFANLADIANQEIKRLILSGNRITRPICFLKLFNFNNPKYPVLLEDGVHLNQRGVRKYYRSVRGAILHSFQRRN